MAENHSPRRWRRFRDLSCSDKMAVVATIFLSLYVILQIAVVVLDATGPVRERCVRFVPAPNQPTNQTK